EQRNGGARVAPGKQGKGRERERQKRQQEDVGVEQHHGPSFEQRQIDSTSRITPFRVDSSLATENAPRCVLPPRRAATNRVGSTRGRPEPSRRCGGRPLTTRPCARGEIRSGADRSPRTAA